MSVKPKLGYLILNHPSDRTKGSGIYYYQRKALEELFEIYLIRPSKFKRFLIQKLQLVISKLNILRSKQFLSSHSVFLSKIYGKDISRKINKLKLDYIFGDKVSILIAYLKIDTPIIYSTDAFVSGMLNYYPDFTNLSKRSIAEANKIESNSIKNSSYLIVPSKWAADCAINYYGAIKEKLLINPRGANLEEIPDREKLDFKKKELLNLIFIGVEWKRKGGRIAYETMQFIRNQGQKVSLTIVGCYPPDEILNDKDVNVIPYLDKGKPVDREKFYSLIAAADFQILPTRADCFAISVSECSAFGIPSFVTDTGGIAVQDNVNGFRLSFEAKGIDYGRAILKVYNDEKLYYDLRMSTRLFYEKELNWNVWIKKLEEFLKKE